MNDNRMKPTDYTGPSEHGAQSRPPATRFSADRELEEMLRDAEETVAQLKAELANRKATAQDPGGSTEEQHEEIAKLAEHLENAKVHWGEVRAFFHEALRELTESRRRRGDQR